MKGSLIFSSLNIDTLKEEDIKNLFDKILNIGYDYILVEISDLSSSLRILDYLGKYDYRYFLRFHLKWDLNNFEITRTVGKRRIKSFIRNISRLKKKCYVLSIDEEYTYILSPNDLVKFKIIKLKKFRKNIIRRFLNHPYLLEVYIDDLIKNLEKTYVYLSKIKIIESKSKTLVSQHQPLFGPKEVSIIFYTLIDEDNKTYRELSLRLNRVLKDCL